MERNKLLQAKLYRLEIIKVLNSCLWKAEKGRTYEALVKSH
jgi:hypothetical protein